MAAPQNHSTRVLWLFRNFYPELAGGAERYRRYAPQLQKRGVHVDVLTASNPDLAPDPVIDRGPPRVIRIPRPAATPAVIDHLLIKRAYHRIRNSSTTYETLQVSTVHLVDLPYLLLLRLMGVKVVLACTIIAESPPPRPKVWLRRLARRLAGIVTHRVCSTVIVSSTCMARARMEEGASARQIRVICNGVDLKRFHPVSSDERTALRRQLGVPVEAQVILYMGGMVPRKQVHLLIEAFHHLSKQLPRACLFLVGPMQRPTMFEEGQQDELTRYQELLRDLAGDSLGQRIIFPGETSEPQIWFNAADLFAFCPVNEGFGNVVIEAMSSGIPVVMTPFIGLAEELGVPDHHYAMAEANGDSLSEAIQNLLFNQTHRETMISHALSLVAEKHALDITLDQLADVCHGRALSRLSSAA